MNKDRNGLKKLETWDDARKLRFSASNRAFQGYLTISLIKNKQKKTFS